MTNKISPDSTNLLAPTGHQFIIKKLPTTKFYTQKVVMPSMMIPPTYSPNPLVNIPYSGDHISYEDLTISFLVDEEMENYMEVHKWLRGMGFPATSKEYADLEAIKMETGDGLRSDCTLIILDGKKRPNIQITFYDAFPYYLGRI